ncbi:hypothetical protein [Abditibacterium utsteinense]|uniref:hypothetical protein n=1 Tax=Abditibacterium utsteinense TaxID=1960156 RepID=UPI0019310B0E|nr:hypothetical protein [Abditibacterium utsteinense]
MKLLNSKSVDYLLIGGYAVGAHGYVRATGDIDFWVRVSPENAGKLVAVFQEFGFGSLGLTIETFLNPIGVVRVGNSPLKIEVLNAISGV